jgi:hypothetical protein
MMKRWAACALMAFLVTFYSVSGLSSASNWPSGTVFKYTYSTTGEPSGAGDAFRSAVASWDVAATCYSFSEEGGLGVVQWITNKDVWDIIRLNASQTALAICRTNYSTSFAIYFNAAYWATSNWSTSCSSGTADVKSISLHELGHVLGLDECSNCSNTVMDTPYDMSTPDCWSGPFDTDKNTVNLSCINPAASIYGFSVSDGIARWRVTSQYETQCYLMEGDCTQLAASPFSTMHHGMARTNS